MGGPARARGGRGERTSRKRALGKAFGGFFLAVLFSEKLRCSFRKQFFSPDRYFSRVFEVFLGDLMAGVV